MPLSKWTRWFIYSLPFVIFHYCLLPIYSFPAEDASILFSYAENFIRSATFSYYPGGETVFATSDVLFLFLVSGLMSVGVPAYMSTMIISAISAMLCVFLLLSILKSEDRLSEFLITALFFTFYQHFAGIGGYSTIVFAAALLLVIHQFDKQEYVLLALSCFILGFIRLEGFIYALPIIALSFFDSYASNQIKKGYHMIALFAILISAYFLLLYLIFGSILPSPFYVKSIGEKKIMGLFNLPSLYLNYHYLKFYVTLLAAFIFIAAIKKKLLPNKLVFVCFGIGLFNLLFYSLFKQEMNLFYRYQFPFTIILLIIWGTCERQIKTKYLFKIATILLISFNLLHFEKGISGTLVRKYSNVHQIGLALSKIENGKLGTTESGIIPWLSRWESVDFWGLNTPTFSQKLPQKKDIMDAEFDLIIMHAPNENYAKIFNQIEGDPPLEKTWENMCLNITQATKESFDLIMVPSDIRTYQSSNFDDQSSLSKWINGKNIPSRHDAFYVNQNSAQRQSIINLLHDHGGISYEQYLD